MQRRALICAGVLPAALPFAAMAFRVDAERPAADPACATPEALRSAHARHPLSDAQRKMMEEGGICPICGCPPLALPPHPAKVLR